MKHLIVIVAVVFIACSSTVFASSSSAPADGGDSGGIVSGFLDGLKNLFIPKDGFFNDFKDEIFDAVDEKTGGLITSIKYISDQFNSLVNCTGVQSPVFIEFKADHFFKGYEGVKVNPLDKVEPFTKWFRPLTSSFFLFTTIFICYRKVISMFKT